MDVRNGRRAKVNQGLTAIAAAALCVPVGRLEATTVWESWYSSTSGSWSDASNWDAYPDQYEGMAPNNTESVTYDAVLGGGVVTLDENVTINHLGLYQYVTLNGPGDLTVLTGMDWYAGTVSGTGALNISSGITLNLIPATPGNSSSRTIGRTVNNYGTVNYTGGSLNLNTNGVFNNYGTFNASTGNNIFRSGGSNAFNNLGTFNKTGDTEFRITSDVVNSGAININAGTMRFETLTNAAGGSINVAAGASAQFEWNVTGVAGSSLSGPGAITFVTGTHTFAAGTFQPTGTVNFNGGTVTLNNAFTPASLGPIGATVYFNADQSLSNVTQTGTIRGTGTLTITNGFVWNGGIQYDGATVIAQGATGTIAPTPSNTVSLYFNRTLTNYGTLEHSAGAFTINQGGVLNNLGQYKASSDTGIGWSSGAATFNNGGTFVKTGTGTYTIRPKYINTGTTDVQAGTLVLPAVNSTNAGTIQVAAGANLELANDMTYAPGSTLTGAGNVLFSDGDHDLSAATYAATGAFQVSGSTAVTIANAISPSGTIVIGVGKTSSQLTLLADQTFADLDIYGSLHGTGNLTLTHHVTWGGNMDGAGKTTIASGATADVDNLSRTISRTVDNYGTFNYAQGTVFINNGGAFNNYGTVNASSAGGFPRGSGTAAITNYATFNKSDTTTFVIQSPFTNQPGATVNLSGGTLQFNSGGTNNGTINLAAGATLALSTTYNYAPDSSISGGGNVTFSGGTHVLPADTFFPTGVLTVGNNTTVTINNVVTPSSLDPVAGTLNFNADETFANVTLSGTIGGSGNVTISNGFSWTGGTLAAGGATTLAATATGALTGQAHTLSRTLENYGSITHTGGTLTLNSTATFNNYGSFVTSNIGNISRNSGAPAINNFGTLTKTGTSTLTIGVLLNNAAGGLVNIDAGNVEFTGSGNVNNGTINLAGAASLKFNNGFTYGIASSLTGPGGVWFSSGTHNFPAGAYSATGPLTIDGTSPNVTFNSPISPSSIAPLNGTLNFNANQTLAGLSLLGSSTLGGSGNLTLTDSLAFQGGTLGGTGLLTMAAGSTLDMSNNVSRTISRNVDLYGTTNYTDGSISLSGTAVTVSNYGTFNLAKGGINRNSGADIFKNAGTVHSTAADATIAGQITLDNPGTLNVISGKLTLGSAPAQFAAGTLTGGTWVMRDGATLIFPSASNITTNNAALNLYGPNSKFDKLNTLTTNNGSLSLYDGRSFSTTGAFANNGYVFLAGSSMTFNGAVTGAGNVTVGDGSTLTAKSNFSQTGGPLTVAGTFIQQAGGASTLLTKSLKITGAGHLDINDNKFVVDYDPLAGTQIEMVRQDILGGGIMSSVAAADQQGIKAIGYAEASMLGVTSWGGLSVDSTSVVAMLTLAGDANLDGQVIADDFALIDRGLLMGRSGWVNGDFNHDGAVTTADYLLIDHTLAIQSGLLSPAFLANRESRFGPDYVAALVASVPEPSSIALAALAIPFIARRRRSSR